jgi:four helix bundle protein
VTETYKDLKVWRRAMDLVVDVYRCTASFPKPELYGLTSQMRRSAVSVPSNIAECKGRFSRKELVQFLFRARGSLLELETQITIGQELGYRPGGLQTTHQPRQRGGTNVKRHGEYIPDAD